MTLESTEREAILRALRRSAGRVSRPRGVAAMLGLKRTTLQARMLKLGILKEGWREPQQAAALP